MGIHHWSIDASKLSMETTSQTFSRRSFLRLTTSTSLALPFASSVIFSCAVSTPVQRLLADTITPQTLLTDPGMLANRAQTLIKQIGLGFGYYGQPRNYVPTLSIEYFQKELTTLIRLLVDSDDWIKRLSDKVEKNLNTIDDLDQATNKVLIVKDQCEKKLALSVSNANDLQSIIKSLEVEVLAQKQRMLDAQDRFQKAVEAAGNGCNLERVLTITAAIVAVAASVYTAGSSLAVAGALLSSAATLYKTVNLTTTDGVKQATTDISTTYSKIEPAVTKGISDVEDVIAKYELLKTDLANNPDSARVALPQDEFDHLTSDFDANVDKASIDQSIKDDFKSQAHHYVDLVQARNKKILERDGLLLLIVNLDRAVAECDDQIRHLADIKARTIAPAQYQYLLLIQRMQANNYELLCRLLWEEIRALALWNLDPIVENNVQIVGRSGQDLLQTHLTLQAEFVLTEANEVVPPQPIDPKVKLNLSLLPEDAARLAQGGEFHFTIRPDQFPNNMCEVFATEVIVELIDNNNVKIDGFAGTLQHLGRHLFIKRDGTILEYSTNPLPIVVESNTTAVSILFAGTNGKYLGVSPFADWALSPSADVDKSILASAKVLHLEFGGRMRGRVS